MLNNGFNSIFVRYVIVGHILGFLGWNFPKLIIVLEKEKKEIYLFYNVVFKLFSSYDSADFA